jgi:hypothetical protein
MTMEFPPELLCGVCSDAFEVGSESSARCAGDGLPHNFCRGCVGMQVNVTANSHRTQVPCLQAGCGNSMRLEGVEWPEIVAPLQQVVRRCMESLLLSPNSVEGLKIGFCLRCRETGAVNPADKIHHCAKCDFATCLECEKSAHNGACGVQEMSLHDRAVAAATATSLYECECGLKFVRGSGCMSLQCPRCLKGFCANCCSTFTISRGQNQHDLDNPHFCRNPHCDHIADCGLCPHVPIDGFLAARSAAAFIQVYQQAGEPEDSLEHALFAQFGKRRALDARAYLQGAAFAPAGSSPATVAAYAAKAVSDREVDEDELSDDGEEDDDEEEDDSEEDDDDDEDSEEDDASPEVVDLVSDDEEPEITLPTAAVVVAAAASAVAASGRDPRMWNAYGSLVRACEFELAQNSSLAVIARQIRAGLETCPDPALEGSLVAAYQCIERYCDSGAPPSAPSDEDDELIDRTRAALLRAFDDPNSTSQDCAELSKTLCAAVAGRAVRRAVREVRTDLAFGNPEPAHFQEDARGIHCWMRRFAEIFSEVLLLCLVFILLF